MKAKLIKLDNNYFLKIRDTTFATSATPNLGASIRHSLSLKNCQAIERWYDLDELADEWIFEKNEHKWSNNDNTAGDNYGSFKAGFHKALEIYHNDLNILPRKTEWDVEIEMEEVQSKKTTFIDPSTRRVVTRVESIRELKPKLDADGCLILKRV